MSPAPFPEFSGVTVRAKANVYFDGNVISHTVRLADGTAKTRGLIRPGSYHFGTTAPERMEIVAGNCQVTLDGTNAARLYAVGDAFEVPGQLGFTIAVDNGLCEYVCTLLVG